MAQFKLKGNDFNTAGDLPAVDGEGKVVHTELCPETTEEPDYDAALAALK